MSIVFALPRSLRETCQNSFMCDIQGPGDGGSCGFAMKRPSAIPLDRRSL